MKGDLYLLLQVGSHQAQRVSLSIRDPSRATSRLVYKPTEFPLLQRGAPLHLLLLSFKMLNTECFTQLLVSLKPTSHLENVCVGC